MDFKNANEQSREAWDRNAAYWDSYMGEGNDYVEILLWPAIEKLIELKAGDKVLDVACGNGLTSRRLAQVGASVVAFDFSEKMIEHAIERSREYSEQIEYLVLDGSDENALLNLGENVFDAALCNMALFDMAEIDPLFRALNRLIKPGGRFVFSILHPCFNSSKVTRVAEQDDREGEMSTVYSLKVYGYKTAVVSEGIALRDQPVPQPYFHRSLAEVLNIGFELGFVLDKFEEPTFPPDHPAGRDPLSFGANFSDIPPVLVARMRLLE
jgi:2-polyprenyl-3-methyl-5-hydroxy-6-metoxy-1,4-benzoquinol methylase